VAEPAAASRRSPPATRGRLALAAALVVGAVPLVLALTDGHLAGASAALTLSTAAAAVAIPVIAIQPLLAGRGWIGRHRLIGSVALALVLVHIGALFVESADDTLFAMSPDGPTRARMALMATIALLIVVALGAGRRRLPVSGTTWRILHAYFALLVIVLGFGHALLTSGALDGAGTVVLLAFGALGVAAIPVAYAARARRARS
jgi:3-phenylpropionate/trans-cinnamate dioxygenase ferredoxin reductase subunit